MSIFGNDSSSHNQPLASRDGLDFYTHKATDGQRWYLDPAYASHMAQARSLGIPVLGSYHVLWGGKADLGAQADWWLETVNRLTPWWRDQVAWIWQCDAEPFGYNTKPTIYQVNTFGDMICSRAQIPAASYLAYAPNWAYGSSLTGLRYRLWQSNYGNNPSGWYKNIYPGDGSTRWNAPVSPLVLQYGSRATVGGRSPMDANAVRGTLAEFIATLGGSAMLTDEDIDRVVNAICLKPVGSSLWPEQPRLLLDMWKDPKLILNVLRQVVANQEADRVRDTAMTAAIQALAAAGGADPAPIIEAINSAVEAARADIQHRLTAAAEAMANSLV